MDNKFRFLQAVVGDDGANALNKAAERAAELERAIFARVVLAWLDVTAPFGYDGNVPGTNVPFVFAKSENHFAGSIALNGEMHHFTDASIAHLAGCVAVSLGLDHERVSPFAKNEQLAKLGKSIDLLVKSQLVKTLPTVKAAIKPNKTRLPGTTAKPIQPVAPIAPTPTQPKNQKQAPQGAAGTSQTMQLPQLPKVPKKKASIQITKNESQKKCPHCMRPQFSGDAFKGCFCWAALAKSVKATPTNEGYTLQFGSVWDEDAIATLVETFRGK